MFCNASTCSEVVTGTTGHRPALAIVQLGVAEEQLHGSQILGAPVDQRRLRPSHRVGPVLSAVEAQLVDPMPEDPGVLSGPQMG